MGSQVGSSNYEVFINFRGVDTRNIFVGHLYSALRGCGIHAFMDSKDLDKGEEIVELLTIIKGAKLSIAVFSQRYVESKWCLEELSQMVECHRTNGQIILPIFFKVETSDVKNQSGCFKISSQRHSEEASHETLSRWKDALKAVGDMSGWVLDDRDDQSELVEKVVQCAWIRLEKVNLIDTKHPVGLRSRVEAVLSFLSNKSNTSSKDILFLGICGPGGIGKTTIATAVYNCISKDFSKSCFLEEVREQASQPNGILCLQEKLLYDVSQEETKITNSKRGSQLIKDRLQNMKTLLILDDVGDRTQLNALSRDLDWFGPESRIIVTTRDWSVLSGVPENKNKKYEPKELNEEESLRLFSLYAFSTNRPPPEFMHISVNIVGTTGGLPLALEVLGSDLSMKQDKEMWKSRHRMLKHVPDDTVYEKLKISFDNLHDIEKAMFLDVACLFVGWEEEIVISIWEACGFEPRYRMEVLQRKSLLKIHESGTRGNKILWMHDQIRDLGRGIAYNQRPENPSNHSRLWSYDSIMKVLNNYEGNEMVEGLLLSFNKDFNRNYNTCLHTEDFEKMPKLRLLQVDGATLEGSSQCLPSGLRWLRWHRYPLENLPADFYHEDLVMLDLSHGLFRQAWNNWSENKLFQQLKVLKLSRCCYLSKSPDFSGVPHLEKLSLFYCKALVDLHESIGELQQLVYLNLGYCKSLEKLPNGICRLISLQNLILTCCESLKELPRSIGDLKESLIELSLEETNIEVLPDGIGLLKKLKVLDLEGNKALKYLPRSMENMTSLLKLDLGGRNKLLCIPKLPSSLNIFRVWDTLFKTLPDMQNLNNLEELWFGDFGVKMEQFRGFVKTRTDDEFSELISKVDGHCMVTNHHSWQMQGQQETFLLGNKQNKRQIWIPLQQKVVEGRHSRCMIPDYDDICGYRLIMHVSLGVPKHDHNILEYRQKDRILLEFQSSIHGKDRKTICEIGLAIEGLKNFACGDHIEYIHEFKGFDWFGVQLEGRDAIEISPSCVLWGKVSKVNLFLMKEGPMLDSTECHYGESLIEIVRYN